MTIDKLMQALARLESMQSEVLLFDDQQEKGVPITGIEVTWRATGEVQSVVLY